RDKSGKVIAWSRTIAQGEYVIAANALQALRLPRSRHSGLLAQILRGMGQVVMAPIQVASVAVKVVKDTVSMKTAENIAIAAATGSPLPVATQVFDSTLNTILGVTPEAAKQTKVAAVKTVFGDHVAVTKAQAQALTPGQVLVQVIAPGYQTAQGKASAYWLQPGVKLEDRHALGAQAWLQTVDLAPASSPKKSGIAQEALTLAAPTLEPALAPPGDTLKICVHLEGPIELAPKVRVFAREARTHTVAELKLQADANTCLFAGEMTLPPKAPPGETVLSIVALRAEPVEIKLPNSKVDPLTEFVRRLDDLDPHKPFDYDPLVMAAQNRLDLPLTILDPKLGTAPAAAAVPSPLSRNTPSPSAPPATTPPAAPPGTPTPPDHPAGAKPL
ncbi:MAG TPA: hypothetical protein VKT32_02425, partial [Chthonomonadaceae bacterium]|nr:hypothetical protein [Chthonomonadaceae bacterium]